jgi:dolichol-phosphate mannosyltransferase
MDLSVIIPVRDEEQNLRELVSRLLKVVETLGVQAEIIFVTDINTDDTLEVLKALNREDGRVKTVKLSNSFGQHVAVLAGLDFCRGMAVVLMDGDMQDEPESLPALYGKLNEGYDVVYAVKSSKNESRLRNFLSRRFVGLLNALSDYEIRINTSMFRILSRRVVNELRRFSERETFLTGLISLIGFPEAEVEVSSGRRMHGATKYSWFRQINMAIGAILSFSSKPVRLVSVFGFIVSGLSLVYLLVVLVQALFFDVSVAGWPTVVSLVTFLGGVQLLAIGIVGEYIGRIFIETKDRPRYIIEERVGEFE